MRFKKIITAAVMLFMMSSTAYAGDVGVNLNGADIDFPHQQPLILQGRTLIPLRGVFDRLGYNILWNGETKTVTLYNSDNYITVNIGDSFFIKNGEIYNVDVPAQIIIGSTMLPLRAIGTAAGCDVSWDSESKTAYITDMSKHTENTETITIKAPSRFGVNFTGDTSVFHGIDADIVWDRAENAQSYEVNVLGETVETENNWIKLKSLNPNTKITVYVKSKAVIDGQTYTTGDAEYSFYTPGFTVSSVKLSEDSEKITREIKWSTYKDDQTTTYTCAIYKSAYETYSSLPRYYGADSYINYMNEEYNRNFLKKFAEALKKMGEESGYSDDELVYETIHFVQSIPYVTDIESRGEEEYPKYPVETMYEFNGDCEDVSILLAGILREMGYGVCFIHVPGHIGVGIKGADDLDGAYFEVDGAKYFYVEATGVGWTLGEYPEDMPNTATIIPIN